MSKTNEIFAVEDEAGELLDSMGEGGFTVFLDRAEAQDAADSEADCRDPDVALTVVRFVRESPRPDETVVIAQPVIDRPKTAHERGEKWCVAHHQYAHSCSDCGYKP